MSDWYSHDEQYMEEGDEPERGFHSTIQDMLHGISRGQGHQVSSSLWDSFIQAAIVFATTWIAANPVFGKICMAVFIAWYAWRPVCLYLDHTAQWLKACIAASVTLPYSDDEIVETIQNFALSHGLLGNAKHAIITSAIRARNAYRRRVADEEVMIVDSNHTLRLFWYKRWLYLLTHETDGKTKIWTFSRSANCIVEMLRDLHVEELQKKSHITVFCPITALKYDKPVLTWSKRPNTDRRTMQSISLPGKTKKRLVKSVQRFLHSGAPA